MTTIKQAHGITPGSIPPAAEDTEASTPAEIPQDLKDAYAKLIELQEANTILPEENATLKADLENAQQELLTLKEQIEFDRAAGTVKDETPSPDTLPSSADASDLMG